MKQIIKKITLILTSFIFVVVLLIYAITYHPMPVEVVPVSCQADAIAAKSDQPFKVMSWNIQYLAGKNYVFFYDKADGSGKDIRPSSQDLRLTLDGISKVILDENPDVLLLQEVDENSVRTDYEDQLLLLLQKLQGRYACHASAYYWKSAFVPHPKVMGSVGMKLSILSRFKIQAAQRYQLAMMPAIFPYQHFNFKRAILEADIVVEKTDSKDTRGNPTTSFIKALNTHLDAFAQGSNTMELQVEQVQKILTEHDAKKIPWFIGGDFNLLASAKIFAGLKTDEKVYYKPETELKKLVEKFAVFPSLEEVESLNSADYITHIPNRRNLEVDSAKNRVILDPSIDRTIDYILYSRQWQVINKQVRQSDTYLLSDHLPLIMQFQLP